MVNGLQGKKTKNIFDSRIEKNTNIFQNSIPISIILSAEYRLA